MAVKVPVVAAAATVMLAGTVKLALLLVRVMEAPPLGAGPLRVKEQALVPGPVKEAGLHVKVLNVTLGAGTATSPPVAEVAMVIAPGLAEDGLVMRMGRVGFIPEERVKLPVAMTPSEIVLALRPLSKQVYEPLAPKQVKDLAELAALGPGVTLIALKSAGEYVNVHSRPAGFATEDAMERSRDMLPPAGAVPEDSDSTIWAELKETETSGRINSRSDLLTEV